MEVRLRKLVDKMVKGCWWRRVRKKVRVVERV